jgi:hypothetical protein
LGAQEIAATLTGHHLPEAAEGTTPYPDLVSNLVSFTPVRHRSPTVTRIVLTQATDADGRR